MKTLEEYKKFNYRKEYEFDPEDQVWVVKFPELPGCIAHGTTEAEALEHANEAKDEWLDEMFEADWTIPEPYESPEVSGRITVRVPKFIHEKVSDRAKQEGSSINQLILTYISQGLEESSSEDRYKEMMKQFQETMIQSKGIEAPARTDVEQTDQLATIDNQSSARRHQFVYVPAASTFSEWLDDKAGADTIGSIAAAGTAFARIIGVRTAGVRTAGATTNVFMDWEKPCLIRKKA